MGSSAVPPPKSSETPRISPFRSVVYSGNLTFTSAGIVIESKNSSARKKLQPAVQVVGDTATGRRLLRAQQLYLQGCDYLDKLKNQKGLLQENVPLDIASNAVACFGEAYLTDYDGFAIDQATNFWLSDLLGKQLSLDISPHLIHVANGMATTVAYLTARDQLVDFKKSNPKAPKTHLYIKLAGQNMANLAQELLQSFKTAAELESKDPRVYKVYGHALATCGHYEDAMKKLEKALAAASELPAEDPRCFLKSCIAHLQEWD